MFYKSLNFINLFILSLFYFNFPKISIIIPIYNNKALKECLDNLKYQTLKNIEMIGIIDKSIDKSFENLMKYNNDNRFIIINTNNYYFDDFINEGIKFVSGEYIGIIESNYIIDNNMFENLYKLCFNNNIDIIRYNYHLNKDKFFFFNLR